MIPLIHFYSTMTICQVEYMNQSVLNDIRNNGCSDDQFPMIPEMALSQMEWVEWWKNYERSTPTRSLHLHNNNLNNSTTSRKRKHINF